MRISEYYELNLVEGTDLVNPLIQDVPNYEKIDEQMFLNSVASVGQAVELKSGTVHALTRENPDASMFRFVATSKYDRGDTFVVDGVQVTGLRTDGKALDDGAYVINSNVLCCLTGTVLTLFVASGDVVTAENALKLGGEEPSYYGKTSDVVTATNTANAAGFLAREVKEEVSGYDLSRTSLDEGTTFKEFIQMLIEKNFPKIVNILTKSTTLWKTLLSNYTPSSNSVTYTDNIFRWQIRGNESGGEHKALLVLDEPINLTVFNTLTANGSLYADGAATMRIGLYANRPTAYAEPDIILYSASVGSSSRELNENFDISNYNGTYYIGLRTDLYNRELRQIALRKFELS